MENEKVFAMSFSRVYGILIAKAERKGRARAEVEEVTFWLPGTPRSRSKSSWIVKFPMAISSDRLRQ